MATRPGVKDKEWSRTHPNKTSCQMLMMAEHKWFTEAAARQAAVAAKAGGVPDRSEAYAALKEQWKQAALEILFMYFPKVCKPINVLCILLMLSRMVEQFGSLWW